MAAKNYLILIDDRGNRHFASVKELSHREERMKFEQLRTDGLPEGIVAAEYVQGSVLSIGKSIVAPNPPSIPQVTAAPVEGEDTTQLPLSHKKHKSAK